MEIADDIVDAADRLGVEPTAERGKIRIARRGDAVVVDAAPWFETGASRTDRFRASWTLVGVRLGLDKRASTSDSSTRRSPTSFRRTGVRHYHEAPSVHGDRLQLLVPRLARRVFEAVADTRAFFDTWKLDALEKLVVRERGVRFDVLTRREQDDGDPCDDTRWEKSRSALFYQSYKVRPRKTRQVDGGRLRIFETAEGFGGSRALLLPDFDYHAARDRGYFTVPGRDHLVVARPDDEASAPKLVEPLREITQSILESTPFGLTDAVFRLAPEDIAVDTAATFGLNDDVTDRIHPG